VFVTEVKDTGSVAALPTTSPRMAAIPQAMAENPHNNRFIKGAVDSLREDAVTFDRFDVVKVKNA
jgi:hypothetical protein